MNWRSLLFLAILGMLVTILVAIFQPAPGYMDADYYFAGGIQIANGRGFTEPYIWNYLDNPAGLPHPSNTYWMPLTSLLAAAGILLNKSIAWITARIAFVLIASALPPLTALLSWSLTSRRDLAWLSGFFAVFSVFYLPYFPITDTFGTYMLLGVLFFLVIGNLTNKSRYLILGLFCGLFHLTRADGLIWLVIAFMVIFLYFKSKKLPPDTPSSKKELLINSLVIILGYLVIMGPWFIRNYLTFGTLLAPGSSKALWLINYDQLFVFPSSSINFSSWWQSGLMEIGKSRIQALGMNISTAFSVQGEIILFPFILTGIWHLRKNSRVQIAVIAWLTTFIIMTFIFPFAGSRGGFFHSAAALQPIWWVLAPLGLDRVLHWSGSLRKWNLIHARKVFQPTLVVIVIFLSIVIFFQKVIGIGNQAAWGKENSMYGHVNDFLVSEGMTPFDIVISANPPGFYIASGNQSIAVPDGNPATISEIAWKYQATYLILEVGSTPAELVGLYNYPQSYSGFVYLGSVDGTHVYRIK